MRPKIVRGGIEYCRTSKGARGSGQEGTVDTLKGHFKAENMGAELVL